MLSAAPTPIVFSAARGLIYRSARGRYFAIVPETRCWRYISTVEVTDALCQAMAAMLPAAPQGIDREIRSAAVWHQRAQREMAPLVAARIRAELHTGDRREGTVRTRPTMAQLRASRTAAAFGLA